MEEIVSTAPGYEYKSAHCRKCERWVPMNDTRTLPQVVRIKGYHVSYTCKECAEEIKTLLSKAKARRRNA